MMTGQGETEVNRGGENDESRGGETEESRGGETEESRGGETEESRGGETEENKESSGNVREKAGKKKKDDRRQRMQQKRGAKVEDIAEKAGQVMGGGTGGAVLVHVGTNNADKEGTSAIIGKLWNCHLINDGFIIICETITSKCQQMTLFDCSFNKTLSSAIERHITETLTTLSGLEIHLEYCCLSRDVCDRLEKKFRGSIEVGSQYTT
ncbi:hypothetical protein LSAT2_031505 [Lamellibrachia satsuma]|nr:hypothetical protein LSAT2_031505 [Lamellibrachia satsuma]